MILGGSYRATNLSTSNQQIPCKSPSICAYCHGLWHLHQHYANTVCDVTTRDSYENKTILICKELQFLV